MLQVQLIQSFSGESVHAQSWRVRGEKRIMEWFFYCAYQDYDQKKEEEEREMGMMLLLPKWKNLNIITAVREMCFLKTLREVIARVYFADLITVYKTICHIPAVSTVNCRIPVIFQMWLPPWKEKKTREKNWRDPVLGQPLNSSTWFVWGALRNSLILASAEKVPVSSSALGFLLQTAAYLAPFGRILPSPTLGSWYCPIRTAAQALSRSGHASNGRVCKRLCGIIRPSLIFV